MGEEFSSFAIKTNKLNKKNYSELQPQALLNLNFSWSRNQCQISSQVLLKTCRDTSWGILGVFRLIRKIQASFKKSPGIGNITEKLLVFVTLTGDWCLNSMGGMGEIWTLIFTGLHWNKCQTFQWYLWSRIAPSLYWKAHARCHITPLWYIKHLIDRLKDCSYNS